MIFLDIRTRASLNYSFDFLQQGLNQNFSLVEESSIGKPSILLCASEF